MFCHRCGKELSGRAALCPVCETPQKRRQRRRQRLLVGLFLFLSGAFVGSMVDSLFFKGKAWEQSIFNKLFGPESPVTTPPQTTAPEPRLAPEDVTFDDRKVPFPPVPEPVRKKPGKKPEPPAVPTIASLSEVKPVPEALQIAQNIASQETAVIASPASAGPEPTATPASSVAISVAATVPQEVALPPAKYFFQFNKAIPLEEGEGSNFHGGFSADHKVLLFASNRSAQNASEAKFQAYIQEGGVVEGGVGAAPAMKLFPWKGNVWTPEFSPDGSFLVFSSDSTPKEHLFRYDRATRETRPLTTGNSKNMMSAISPDGKFVAFVSDRKGNNDIWIVGVDGNGLTQVTSGPEDDREPRWWPNGKALLFTRIVEKLKVSDIMKVSLDPLLPPEKLLDNKARNWLADVSPDATCLAYVRSEKPDGSGNSIHVLRLEDQKDLVIAPFKGAEHFRPIWTADGKSLVFHSDKQKRKSLYEAVLQKVADN